MKHSTFFMAGVGAGLTPALPDGCIECEIAAYGKTFYGVQMNRKVAEEYAQEVIRTHMTLKIAGIASYYRIIDTRLEDDNPGDPTRGRVVAICQPLPSRQMEVK